MMEPEGEKKKLNDDAVVFLRKRSEAEVPRYSVRLRAYADLRRRRNRASAAKKRAANGHQRKESASRKKNEQENEEINPKDSENPGREEDRGSKRRVHVGGKPEQEHTRSSSRGRSEEPVDRCGRRRRRRSRCRRRRRSCRRRRRSRRRRRRRRSCCCRKRRKRRRSGCRRKRRRRC